MKYRVMRLNSTPVLLGTPSRAITSVMSNPSLALTAKDNGQDQIEKRQKDGRQNTTDETLQNLDALRITLQKAQPLQPRVRVDQTGDT